MAFIEVPGIVLERAEEFNRLCIQNPRSIPSDAYADFCGMDRATFRTLVERGECPFGFGKNPSPYGRGFARIPMLAAYNWHTCGAANGSQANRLKKQERQFDERSNI